MEILKVRNLDTVNLIFDNLLYIYYIIDSRNTFFPAICNS